MPSDIRTTGVDLVRSGQYESLLHSLFRATDYGVLVTDIEGTDILCNPRFGVLFGMDIEKVVRLPRDEVRQSALDRVKDREGFLAVLARAYADPWLEIKDE